MISLVPVSSHILNQTSFYKTMIGTSLQCSVSRDTASRDDDVIVGVFVTWLWGHMIFRFILFWNVQIGRNSLVTSAYTCGGFQVRLQQFFLKCCILICNPLDYFCASEFRSKAIWPTADNRLKKLQSAPSGGNHICATSYQVHQNHIR